MKKTYIILSVILMMQSMVSFGTESKKKLERPRSARTTQKRFWTPAKIVGASILGAAVVASAHGITWKALLGDRYVASCKVSDSGLRSCDVFEVPYPICRLDEKPKPKSPEVCPASMLPDCPASLYMYPKQRIKHGCQISLKMMVAHFEADHKHAVRIRGEEVKKELINAYREAKFMERMQQFKDGRRRN